MLALTCIQTLTYDSHTQFTEAFLHTYTYTEIEYTHSDTHKHAHVHDNLFVVGNLGPVNQYGYLKVVCT